MPANRGGQVGRAGPSGPRGHHAGSIRTKSGLTTRFEDLVAALRAGAAGLYCAVAAVELLIGQERWLHRVDFVARFVETVPAWADGSPMALVDWRRATAAVKRGQLACSSGEGQVLRLCASLADGVPVDLAEALTSL